MTTFDTFESSVEGSRPVEIYEFSIGAQTYYYTSSEGSVTVGANDYTEEALSRGSIAKTAQKDPTLSIKIPATNEFAARYIGPVPTDRATLSIFRRQRSATTGNLNVLIFKGDILSVKFPGDGTLAQIEARSIEGRTSAQMPRMTYQGVCNNFLGDRNCLVDMSGHNHIGTITAVSGNVITLSGASTALNVNGQVIDFVGGYCTPTGVSEYRSIIAQSGNDLTLQLPFSFDVTGASVQAFAGCDHIRDSDCALVYNNVSEFIGFHFVPTRNPFESGLDTI